MLILIWSLYTILSKQNMIHTLHISVVICNSGELHSHAQQLRCVTHYSSICDMPPSNYTCKIKNWQVRLSSWKRNLVWGWLCNRLWNADICISRTRDTSVASHSLSVGSGPPAFLHLLNFMNFTVICAKEFHCS